MLYDVILDKFLHHTKQYLFCLRNNFFAIPKRNPVGLLQTERESTGKTWAGLGTQAPSISKTLPACKSYVYFNTEWQNAIGLHLKYTKVYTFNGTFISLLHADHNSNNWRNMQPIITSTIIQVSEHLTFNVICSGRYFNLWTVHFDYNLLPHRVSISRHGCRPGVIPFGHSPSNTLIHDLKTCCVQLPPDSWAEQSLFRRDMPISELANYRTIKMTDAWVCSDCGLQDIRVAIVRKPLLYTSDINWSTPSKHFVLCYVLKSMWFLTVRQSNVV